jgi:hypothetical protein
MKRKQRRQQQQQQQQPHLPQEVLIQVLQRVQQRQRLRSCSLVCHAWNQAAAAATKGITLEVAGINNSSITQWLRKHGSNLTRLKLTSGSFRSGQLLCLPYVQLTQLRSFHLEGFLLDAEEPAAAATGSNPSSKHGSSSSSSSNLLSHLSSLTQLHLQKITFGGCFSKGLRSLAALTALQDLTLGHKFNMAQASTQQQQQQQQQGTRSAGTVQPAQNMVQLLSLNQLTQLTRIEMNPGNFSKAAVAPLSALQQLQYVKLHSSLGAAQAARLLADLPASITHLQFSWGDDSQPLSCSNAPGISSLTALRNLQVLRWGPWKSSNSRGGFDPLLLSRLQQLRVLELHWSSRDALPGLLKVMPGLSNLVQLDLECGDIKALPATQAARYALRQDEAIAADLLFMVWKMYAVAVALHATFSASRCLWHCSCLLQLPFT